MKNRISNIDVLNSLNLKLSILKNENAPLKFILNFLSKEIGFLIENNFKLQSIYEKINETLNKNFNRNFFYKTVRELKSKGAFENVEGDFYSDTILENENATNSINNEDPLWVNKYTKNAILKEIILENHLNEDDCIKIGFTQSNIENRKKIMEYLEKRESINNKLFGN